MQSEILSINQTLVVKNPETKDYLYFEKKFHEDFPCCHTDAPRTRCTYDKDGNKYIWYFDRLHFEIEPALEKRFNTKVDQNKYFDI